MLLKVEVPAKAFSANAASERLSFVVGVHVEGQVVDLVEGLVANVALVSLLSTMCQTVVLVVAFLMESFPAEFADERLVTSMDSCMRVERRRSVEGFTTRQAFMRFF